MRAVHFSDLTAAARALLPAPPCLRARLCRAMLIEADWADKYTKRHGKPHHIWGNGTLMAVARRRQLMPERSLSDPDYTACVTMILHCLEQHRASKACKLC